MDAYANGRCAVPVRLFCVLLVLNACGGTGSNGDDLSAVSDTTETTAMETIQTGPYQPPDEQFRASVATGPINVPLGIGTAGYGQTGVSDDTPKSPFADGFYATTRVLHPPMVRVIHLMKGEVRLVLVQTDLIGIYFLHFERVVEIVEEATGIHLRKNLVLMASHTHTGPGRHINHLLGGILADSYDDVIAERILHSIAQPIIDTLMTESVPVSFGYSLTQNAEMHKDRRCENPPYQNDTMGILRFERLDGSGSMAAVINYAMHGTIFGYQAAILSGDAPRTVELKVQEALPGAPLVMFTQSWAGDMAPGNPTRFAEESPYPQYSDPNLDQLEALGRSATETVLSVWDAIELAEDSDLAIVSEEAVLRHDVFGYEPGEFDFEFGGAYCGGFGDFCPGSGNEPKMDICIPAPEEASIPQVRLTAFRIGGLTGVTLPGETVTTLGEYLLNKVSDETESTAAMLFSYAQDYTGYLLLPNDWALGGYEAGGNLWGPKQGIYLADSVANLAHRLDDPNAPLSFELATPRVYESGDGVGYSPDASLVFATVEEDLPTQITVGTEVSFSWTGGDPWVDQPHVTLEQLDTNSGEYMPYRSGDRVIDETGYRMVLTMDPTPPWTVSAAPEGRTFRWTVHLRTAVQTPGPAQVLQGSVRLLVSGHAIDDSGALSSYSVPSQAMEISQ